jgi:transposase
MHRSDFPEDISAPLQYGPGVSAFAVYLTQYQLLPFERTATMLDELAGIEISPGTLYTGIETAAERLQAPVAAIREALVVAPIAHADETGMRVGGRASTGCMCSAPASLTAYFAHPKRGGEALEAFGLLARFRGVLVHDHWSAYELFECLHAFCNAHHLRELIAIAETIPSQQPWAEDMIALLCEANTSPSRPGAQGSAALPGPMVLDIQDPLRRHSRRGQGAQPRPPAQTRHAANASARAPPTTSSSASARTARPCCASSPTCACPSTTTSPSATCACPSSSRRSPDASALLRGRPLRHIRSYLSTLRKQSADIFKSLVLTFQGSPPMPRLAPE